VLGHVWTVGACVEHVHMRFSFAMAKLSFYILSVIKIGARWKDFFYWLVGDGAADLRLYLRLVALCKCSLSRDSQERGGFEHSIPIYHTYRYSYPQVTNYD
jgi:hypothetical protein